MMNSIRPYLPTDEAEVVRIWHRSGDSIYTFLPMWQELTPEKALHIFREFILPNSQLWVAEEGEKIVAFMALRGSYIDRLYVDSVAQRQGWGTRLLNHAKELHPKGLRLHTHVENYPARSLYEREGFVAVAFGISPPPESVPDVEYHWRPASPTQNG